MKTAVITGSSQGLGFEMAKLFRQNDYNVVINGTNRTKLERAAAALEAIDSAGEVASFCGSVAERADMHALTALAVGKFGRIDIWINNAGVNQPDKPMWELSDSEIDALLRIDLLGDYPDVVAKFLVESMMKNTKNNAHIQWLTGRKAAWRFMTAGFRKNNYFD